MRNPKLAVVLGLTLFGAGCLAAEPPLEESNSSVTGERKLLSSQRGGLDKVGVHNKSGSHIGDMTGSGLSLPFGVEVANQNVYVVSQATNSVYAHIHASGESEPRGLTELVPPGSGGLSNPFYVTVEDGLLYVSSHDSDEVLRYDALSGDFIDVFVEAGAGGLDGPRGIHWGPDGYFYVNSSITNEVLVYDSLGTFSHVFNSGIPVPCGLDISSGGDVCVGSAGNSGVHCFDLAGAPIFTNTEGKVCGLGFGPDGQIYTSRPDINAVTVHDLDAGSSAHFADSSFVVAVGWGFQE